MPDLAKTRRALIDQVLANLHVLAEGQTPAAEDVAKVDRIIDPVFAQLAARDVTYVPDGGVEGPSGGAIDPACFLQLAHIVAHRCAGSFAQASDPALAALASIAEDELGEIGRPASTRKTLSVDRALRSMRPRRGV
jgi:hypothetical protein